MLVITSILILLGVGLVLGQVFEHFRFAAVAGEILGGFVFGPAILGLAGPSAELTSISDVALFFIMLLIGIEMTTSSIFRSYRKAIPLTIVSFALPLLMMTEILYFVFHEPLAASTIVSLSIGVPSISIVSILVKGYGLLQEPSGQVIISSVIISDLIAFVLLSSFLDTGLFLTKIVAVFSFLVALFVADFIIARNSDALVRAFSRLHATEHGERVIFGSVILGGLLAATFFQTIGFTYVLGAFFAGMIISEFVVGKEILGILTRTLNRMNDSFFIPIYFTIAGLNVIFPGPYYTLVLIILLLISGGLGSYLIVLLSRVMRIDLKVNSVIGFLGSRGAVGVVIAVTALNASLITPDLYSLLLLGTVIFALFFPLLIREGAAEEKERSDTSG